MIAGYSCSHAMCSAAVFSLQLGMNEFADLTEDEYKQKALGYDASLRANRPLRAEPFMYENTRPPKSIDWREKGAVAHVKNQLLVGVH